MAVYTQVELEDASRITEAHGLGATTAVTPIAAGSVNTNYFVDGAYGRRFLRVYEEQDAAGVAYEWALLAHLVTEGLPVPRVVPGVEPGVVSVASKPVALFELVAGEEVCQKLVTPARAAAVGAFLGGFHRAQASFGWRREGRFRRSDLRGRLDRAASAGRPELEAPIARLRALLDALDAEEPEGLPRGVVHGDLFRDNVRFDGERIHAAIDWESAADGVLAYDLMVTVLAWCVGDRLDFDLARTMVRAYDAERPLTNAEWGALRFLGRAVCARFATTRITDFHLRAVTAGAEPKRRFARFLERLDAIEAETAEGFAARLGRRG